MDDKIRKMFKSLETRNIEGIYCNNREETKLKLLEMIPPDKTIGISGSVTLDEIGVVLELIKRGNKVFNQYEKGLTHQQNLDIRNQGALADIFLSSANAITEKGEMVFFSGHGHRIAGIANAKKVLIVCGINKIVDDIYKGIDRARNYVTPLNCQRLKWNKATRMCCQILVIEAEFMPDRLKVILVGESLGF